MSITQHTEQVNYKITVGSVTIESGLVTLSVTNQINRIPKARLELNYRDIDSKKEDSNYTIQPATNFDQEQSSEKASFMPGEKITIALGLGNTAEEVFTGYITKQNIVSKSNGVLMLYIDCKHVANKMTLTTHTRFLHHNNDTTDSTGKKIEGINDDQVLQSIVDIYDEFLEINIIDAPETTFNHENMVQYNCSDWDFLVMRAEATGRVCKIQENKIQIIKPETADSALQTLTLGTHIFEYEAEYDETKIVKEITTNNWKIEDQEAISNTERNINANLDASEIQDDYYFNHSSDLSDEETRAWATNKLNRQELGKILGTVKTFGNTKIELASSISISGFNSVWDGITFVSGIKHVMRKGLWHTHLQCGISSNSHAETFNINASDNNELLASSNGLLYGKVIAYKNSGEGYELIEVEIPSINDRNENKPQSIYARLSTLSAGQNGGTVFRPYPDDEVVIGFIDNDPRFPVILGSLYNSTNNFAFGVDDEGKKQPEIGFAFNFNGDERKDKPWKISIHQEEGKMTIASPGGQSFVLDDQEKSIQMAFDDSNGIKITSEGIAMDASKIIMKGTNGIELEGLKIEAKASTSLKLEASTQLELQGKALVSVQGQTTKIN